MIPRAAIFIGLASLLGLGCSTPAPGEVVIRVEGSVSSLVTTIPEATTTTVAGTETTTSLPGLDPGSCPAPGETVIIALADGLAEQAPCAVSTEAMLRFSNLTSEPVTIEWAGRQIEIAAQRSVVPPETVGEVLTPGLHAFVTSIESTPTVLVAAPDSGFGAAQVGLRSFGGVRPGQRISEVEAAIGLPIVVADRGADCSVGWIAGDPHSPLLALDATEDNPIVLRVQATTATQRTLSDVGIGSALADVQNAYGDQFAQLSEFQYAFEPNESIDANYRLVFDISDTDATVTAMRIGRLGEIERQEVC